MKSVTDPIRQLLRETLAARGLNMSSVSKKLGKNHAYLHQFLDRGIPARLPESIREQLAVLLDVPEAQLKGDPAQVASGSAIGSRTSRGSLVPSATDRIPVLSTGRETAGGWMPWTGEIVDYVSRPPQLAGATQPYALYVSTSGMEPRYEVGEVIYVHPGKPVTPGAFVLVQVRPEVDGEKPRAAIRRFIRRSATKVTLEQLSPPKQNDVRASDILEMHRIVGSAESSG